MKTLIAIALFAIASPTIAAPGDNEPRTNAAQRENKVERDNHGDDVNCFGAMRSEWAGRVGRIVGATIAPQQGDNAYINQELYMAVYCPID